MGLATRLGAGKGRKNGTVKALMPSCYTGRQEGIRANLQVLDPLMFVRSFHLFSAVPWRKFPVHCIVNFQLSSIANRFSRHALRRETVSAQHSGQALTFRVIYHFAGARSGLPLKKSSRLPQ